MLNKIKKSNSEGFTIIEVMIVLAVAALILLIVLLAVPALERNARNTALKNDASTVAGGITTWESDNNGSTPSAVFGNGSSDTAPSTIPGVATYNAGPTVLICGTAGANCENVQVQTTTNVGYETSTTSAPLGAPTFTSGNPSGNQISTGDILAIFGAACPNTGTAASSRTTAVYYAEETSGTSIIQCLQV
jgi:prepilin-type N-terminal cleavage/methylation domain-containing protein